MTAVQFFLLFCFKEGTHLTVGVFTKYDNWIYVQKNFFPVIFPWYSNQHAAKLVLLLGFKFDVSAILWKACWNSRDGRHQWGNAGAWIQCKWGRQQIRNVFMIWVIFSNLECTVGYHASTGFTGDQLSMWWGCS